MFVVSLTGWMVATTFRVPMTKDLLGIDVPPLVTAVDRSVRQWIEESHMVLAYVLAAVVLIHIVSALLLHIVKRNDVARRMPWRAPPYPRPNLAGGRVLATTFGCSCPCPTISPSTPAVSSCGRRCCERSPPIDARAADRRFEELLRQHVGLRR